MSSTSEDEIMDTVGNLEDDLFGDDDEISEKPRVLSDHELDSGDDEERTDRAGQQEENDDEAAAGREALIQNAILWRQPWPKPMNGELDELRLPKFLGIEPLPYEPENFQLPTTDHHSETKSANYSAHAIATSKMRYQKNSSGKFESNTVVYRWSDGSITLAVGDQHFELQSKLLVPPKENKTYQEVLDSHSYLASPSITSQLLVMVGHLTSQHTVRPNKEVEDDALERLQKSLAAAARGGAKGDDKNGPELITNTQDPELQKKRAELAEKERLKLQRRRENAAAKLDDRRSGRSFGGGGLSVDDLEGRGGRRAPGTGRKPPTAKRPRRRPEYDSDDDMPRGRVREDEYDKNDDFLASSDEEIEGGELDDEEEEELDEESEREEPRHKKQKQKVSPPDELSDADADGENLDDAPAAEVTSGRGRKRNVIEDDDDDEE